MNLFNVLLQHAALTPSRSSTTAYLFVTAAWSVVMALVTGMIVTVGNRPADSRPWRAFGLTFAGILAIHLGYLLAPWAAGNSWWGWSFWLMVPLALLALAVALMPIYGALKWTRPDGGSGWVTILRMGWLSIIVLALYIVPPVLVWFNQPDAE